MTTELTAVWHSETRREHGLIAAMNCCVLL